MQLRQNYTWAIAVPTSMGVRLTPEDRQPAHMGGSFHMSATSAETNAASVSAALGLPVKVLTNFVKGSPIARLLKSDLAARGMSVEGKEITPDGPWGCRHQFNIADLGFGARGPQVYNDRAGEVGRLLSVDDFDLARLFSQEGVAVLHLSGLIAALSPETGRFCLSLAQEAKRHGTMVCFDLNHRASFWKGRDEALRSLFTELASLADILLGNEEDFQLALGLAGPEAGGQGVSGKLESFQGMIGQARKVFTGASVFATTLREVKSANVHLWGAVLWAEDHFHVVEPREIQILDRIGGGDAFVGGLLYALLRGWPPEQWVRFGWACGALATTLLTDYAFPADEDQVFRIYEGNARVQR